MNTMSTFAFPLIFIALLIGIIIGFVTFTCIHNRTISMPHNITLKCKLQENSRYYAVSQEGAFHKIAREDWVLLDTPVCGTE